MNRRSMKILVIEDEPGIASMIRRGLEEQGYQVDVAMRGDAGLRLATTQTYAAIVLDLMLPVMDGWKVCAELRATRNRTPILMLTARDSIGDRVRGLDTGADDYLVKPFDFSELLARIRAMLRREKMHRTRVVRIADLELDTAQRRVTRAGVEVGLSHREYDLFEALATNEGRVLSREAIQERVWMNDDRYSNMVDVYILALRKKIDAGHDAKLIHTVRGVGYTVRQLPAVEVE